MAHNGRHSTYSQGNPLKAEVRFGKPSKWVFRITEPREHPQPSNVRELSEISTATKE